MMSVVLLGARSAYITRLHLQRALRAGIGLIADSKSCRGEVRIGALEPSGGGAVLCKRRSAYITRLHLQRALRLRFSLHLCKTWNLQLNRFLADSKSCRGEVRIGALEPSGGGAVLCKRSGPREGSDSHFTSARLGICN
jgi:hypothetical protein